MKSGPLTKPSGSLCDDEQMSLKIKILEQGERRFLLESNTEVQRKLGHQRLDLVSLISPLLSYGFWSNLVSMESSFQGASNATGYERFGEELAEDVGYYQKLTRQSRSRILVPSILGTTVLVIHPSTLAVLLQF